MLNFDWREHQHLLTPHEINVFSMLEEKKEECAGLTQSQASLKLFNDKNAIGNAKSRALRKIAEAENVREELKGLSTEKEVGSGGMFTYHIEDEPVEKEEAFEEIVNDTSKHGKEVNTRTSDLVYIIACSKDNVANVLKILGEKWVR